MNTSLSKTRFRRVTCAVAAVAAATALTACSTENEDVASGTDTEEQAQSAAGGEGSEENTAPDAPLSDLVLTGEEVPGLNFEQFGDEELIGNVFAHASEGITIEPAECQDLADLQSSDAEGLVGMMSPFEDNSSVVTVGVSPNVERASKISEQVSKCPQFTTEIDNHDLIMDAAGGEDMEMPPEVQEMIRNDFGKSTQSATSTELEAQAPEGVEDFFAYYIEGTTTTMGQEYPTAQAQLVGVVDGVLVVTSSGPLSGFDPVSGEQTGKPGEANKELYQAKAEEVFAAQVEKIRNA